MNRNESNLQHLAKKKCSDSKSLKKRHRKKGLPGKSRGDEESAIRSTGKDLGDDGILDLIFNPKTVEGWLVYSQGKTTQVSSKFKINGKEYFPLIDDNVRKGIVRLPTGLEDYQSTEDLYFWLKRFIAHYYNETDPAFLSLYAAYILLTWIAEKYDTYPYLLWLGAAGGGKTRALETLGNLCRKPTFLNAASTEAHLIRLLDAWRGTAIIDEATFDRHSASHNVIVQILCVGYKRQTGYRGCCEGVSNTPRNFYVGGPKLLASRHEFLDDGLRSRCITRKTGGDARREGQPFALDGDFYEGVSKAQRMLLKWRFDHYHEARLDPSNEIKGVESRVNEILCPLLSVIKDEKIRNEFQGIGIQQQEAIREARRSTLEGFAVGYLADRLVEGVAAVHVKDIATAATEAGVLRKAVSPRTLASSLRGIGLDTPKDRAGIFIDLSNQRKVEAVKTLARSFGWEGRDACDDVPTPQLGKNG